MTLGRVVIGETLLFENQELVTAFVVLEIAGIFRNMNKAITLSVAITLIGLLCSSYQLTAQPTGLFFQNYTTVNGLCDNNVNSITQDTRGFIWIGTREGLSRFDGISF